jgi:WD40 repeat protein
MADMVGQCLGNYRLVRLLGRGGFAQVYLGEHLRLGTQAAMKLLALHLPDDDVEPFLAEARLIARLEHPHIIRILDFDVEQEIPFLVMSYAPNGTLRRRHPRGTRLPLDLVLSYLKQIAAALQFAHDARVIHRDIKPENLLLGRHDEVLLSDFGLAAVAHSSRSQSTQELSGTVAYMAPEQLQGKPRPASDQYALGVVVYEWLCGASPFRGTAAEIVTQHLHTPLPPLRTQLPDLPPAVEEVVLRALEKDPHQRFAGVQEMALAFEEACRSVLPTTAVSPSGFTTQDLLTTDMRAQVPSYSAPTLATSALQPAMPRQGRIRRRALLIGAVALVGLAGAGGGLALLTHEGKPALGTTLFTYTGHLNAVVTVVWSPDGKRVASGSADQTVQVWDATSGAHRLVYRGHRTNVNAVAWAPTPDNQRIASASGNSFFGGEHDVQVWSALTGTHLLTYEGHTQPVLCVAWSPDGTRIASGSEDKTVHIWDANKGSPLLTYTRHTAVVSAAAWSPNGASIASASNDTTVQVWDARTLALRFTLKHTSTVNAVAWSPNGTKIASACGNLFFGGEHTVQVWDATTGGRVLTYTGHNAPVSAVAWSPDGKRLASAASALEKTVRIWDAANGATRYIYQGHTLGVTALAWSPDGQLLASASNDGTVRVWQAT